ncbi:iron-sulfur cluster repair di-iron protein [Peptococcaceae bacterium 1198_IL3148]
MQTFSAANKIGDIVAQFPKASAIFKKYHVDFCCGGDRPLGQAINEQNINESELLTELNKAYQESQKIHDTQIDWRTAPFSELVDYIVNKHHAYLHNNLPALSALTTTVLRAHGTNHKELARVHKLFNLLKLDLEQHLIKEEQEVFPKIQEYEKDGNIKNLQAAVDSIEELENEHEGAGDILKELRSITNNFQLPQDACGTYERTYKIMQELESDLFEHIHLENNILHPRLKQKLNGYN